MALVVSFPAKAVWDEYSPNYYVCDSSGVYDAAGYNPVHKEVYDISATDAHIEISNEYGEGYAVLEGNVILNGGGTSFGTGEQFWSLDKIYTTYYKACIGFYDSPKDGEENLNLQWHISGSLTIKSDTAVLFWNESNGVYDEATGWDTWESSYALPDTSDYIIRCSSVDETTVSRLKPYLVRDSYADNYETEEYRGGNWIKFLNDYSFYATTGEGGYSYIYLAKGGKPQTPVNAITIGKGKEVQLGSSADTTPSKDKPVYLQGGVADASTLDSALLNNLIIQGDGGSLVTGSTQTMTLQGTGAVNYSIVATESSTSAAKLEIGNAGVQSNLELKGASYEAAEVNVNGGVLSISSKTTLGLGSEVSTMSIADKAGVTNYGTIAADMTTGSSCNILNSGTIMGSVDLAKGSILTNNGSISGLVKNAGSIYGSGTFGNTILLPGALLHVGNSPGYQKHTSLTIDRGATLSFSVDGPMAATATTNGSGTYSVLETGTLTINPGTETVNVNVDVTLGIVAAGSEPLSLKLIDAATTNAKEEDFTLKLSDESKLLEEGATLSFNATEGTLVLNAAVSKAALAALMDSNSANVANTMWASANAVQEMARTAEHQFLVGMPGQTTFWGAGMGSFMDVGGKQGFTSNAGGYAVGLQHAFTQSFRAGVALGQSFGDFKSDDNQLRVDQMALMPTLTAQYVTPLTKSSSLSIAGHIAYGVVENEADTYQAGTVGKAEWDDQVLNIGVRAAWNSDLTDNTTVSIFTGLTYQNVDQDSFTEKFTGGERDYHSGSMSSLSIPVGVTLRGIYQMEGTNIFAPELTLAYIGDVARDNPEVKTSVYGFNREGKGTNIGRSAFMLNAGANWMFDSTWSLGAFYTLEARSNQVNQSVNAALRCCF